MSNKIINFTKIRYYMFALSLLLIIGGVVGIVALGGFNLSIDFQAGLSQRIQIAPEGISLTYSGTDDVTLDVVNDDVIVTLRNEHGVTTRTFSNKDYSTIGALTEGLNTIDGIEAVAMCSSSTATADIVTGLSLPYEIGDSPVIINVANNDPTNFISIDEVRKALSDMNVAQVQVVGDEYRQEFHVRAETESEGAKDVLESSISSLLKDAFGENRVVVKGSDYVGPKFSASLSTSSFLVVAIALLLIMMYIWFRFKFAYAVSAITALAHDILIMLGFIAVMRLEVSTTTIAALLTIIGYSLNDTIVVFDRIRENTEGMRASSFEKIINTSITQSLSRTLITSATTLLAVIPLYIFATGSIKLFALNLIIGIVVGTYSSIFIASPILLSLVKRANIKKAKHLGRELLDAEEIDTEAAEAFALVKEEVEIPKAERKKKGKRQRRK